MTSSESRRENTETMHAEIATLRARITELEGASGSCVQCEALTREVERLKGALLNGDWKTLCQDFRAIETERDEARRERDEQAAMTKAFTENQTSLCRRLRQAEAQRDELARVLRDLLAQVDEGIRVGISLTDARALMARIDKPSERGER